MKLPLNVCLDFMMASNAYHTFRKHFTLNLHTQVHECDTKTVMHMTRHTNQQSEK
jgi:hypothetical protein